MASEHEQVVACIESPAVKPTGSGVRRTGGIACSRRKGGGSRALSFEGSTRGLAQKVSRNPRFLTVLNGPEQAGEARNGGLDRCYSLGFSTSMESCRKSQRALVVHCLS